MTTPSSLEQQPQHRRRVPIVVAALVLAAGAIAAGWWQFARPRTRALEPGWPAVTMVLAGDGVEGWRDGDLARARFSEPFDAAVAPDGTIHISDGAANRIRAISRDGRVITVAGGEAGFADGPGADARFNTPSGIALDASGSLYVADTGNNAIRQIRRDGYVMTLAGGGAAGYQDGPASQARFNGPVDVAVAADGRLLVADSYNDRIRAISRDGTVTTLAGTGLPGLLDGPALSAQFDTPAGIAVDRAGGILIADTGNNLVRRLDASGVVSAVPGSASAGLLRPIGIAAAPAGDLYVTDDRGRIVEIARDDRSRVLAGSWPGFRDGPGPESRFRRPSGLAVAAEGLLVVADAGNALVRLVFAPGRAELRLPPSPFIAPGFDADRFRLLPLLWPAPPMDGPHEVAGTLGEARGGEGAERFHAGVDVRVEEGTPVLAVRDGVVLHPIASGDFGSLNEWIRIGDVAYVHVRAGRRRDNGIVDEGRFVASYDAAGMLQRVRVKRGARFRTGEMIASANRFNHVHLNVGWAGEEHNALRFRLTQFEDRLAPTIRRGGIRLFDEAGQPVTARARGRLLVSGRVQIVVDAWDAADGNRPGRRLGLYAVGYTVLNPDGSPAPGFEQTTDNIRFDQLTASNEAARLVYAPGSGIPFYGRRVTRFLYIATNVFRDGVAGAGYWDTSQLPPGNYILRVVARDVHGNMALTNRDLPVTIVAPAGAQSRTR